MRRAPPRPRRRPETGGDVGAPVGVIRELVGRRQTDGRPTWLMYDTYFGASEGLRQFKRWIGLEPYRVSWSWRDP